VHCSAVAVYTARIICWFALPAAVPASPPVWLVLLRQACPSAFPSPPPSLMVSFNDFFLLLTFNIAFPVVLRCGVLFLFVISYIIFYAY